MRTFIVDSMVDAPDTLGKLVGPELYSSNCAIPAALKMVMMLPAKMAETYYHRGNAAPLRLDA